MSSQKRGFQGWIRRKYGRRTICVRCHLDAYTTDFRCRYCNALFPNVNRVTTALVLMIVGLAAAMVLAMT